MADKVAEIFQFALFTRILILFLQMIFNHIVTDYDSSSSIGDKNASRSLDSIVKLIFDGFQKWDSVYFLQIAKEGYQYEQYMAFFPLYPWLITTISTPIHAFFWKFISLPPLLLVVGWCLTSVFFSAAAVFLYKLSLQVVKDKRQAFISSILFCLNPASVFMSGVYTESLFTLCLFCGLYCLEKSNSFINVLAASITLALGTASRSNGITSCGFVIHRLLRAFISNAFIQILPFPRLCSTGKSWIVLLLTSCKIVLSMMIILSPFVAFQLYGYTLFCFNSDKPQSESSNLPWCYWSVPFPYSYIQKYYWNVGLLKYFEVKQIPNFFLAFPMLILCSMAVVEFIAGSDSLTVKTLGLWQPTNKRFSTETKHGFHFPGVFVYIAHLVFLTLFGVTSIHVQVLTRLIASSSPVIYWYASHLITNFSKDNLRTQLKNGLVLGYFITYFVLGIILHCNFYPWT